MKILVQNMKGAVAMSSQGIRERSFHDKRVSPTARLNKNKGEPDRNVYTNPVTGKQITVSVSHPVDRSDGSYRSGGPFYTSLVRQIYNSGYITDAFVINSNRWYTGPVIGSAPSVAERESLGFKNPKEEYGSKNESQLLIDGTNAISYSAPTNPASDLGTGLAETFREGIPSLPGIQAWKRKTEILKGLGSEYLNYVFGWAPLVDEVQSVRDAARHHRDIMNQYHKGEGSDTHRTFRYPLQREVRSLPEEAYVNPQVPGIAFVNDPTSRRQCFLVRETKKWFEGCFTYALPSSTDSWRRSLGFGSQADQLYGIALSPDILWELTPWSWAVDWFSNAGEVINNVTNFGLAGLVLRYGYIMEESKEIVYAEGNGATFLTSGKANAPRQRSGSWKRGTECVTKRRYPASPFGFSIGWEGLSPTQLAITAALGITKFL
jgi:hypothetical protein